MYKTARARFPIHRRASTPLSTCSGFPRAHFFQTAHTPEENVFLLEILEIAGSQYPPSFTRGPQEINVNSHVYDLTQHMIHNNIQSPVQFQ